MGFAIQIKLGSFVWTIQFQTEITKKGSQEELLEALMAAQEDESLKDSDGNRVMGFGGTK